MTQLQTVMASGSRPRSAATPAQTDETGIKYPESALCVQA
jgi:hypothetical protein